MLTCAAGVVVLDGAVRYGSCPFRVVQPCVFGCRNLNLGAATWNFAWFAWIVRLRCPVTTSKRNKWPSVRVMLRIKDQGEVKGQGVLLAACWP